MEKHFASVFDHHMAYVDTAPGGHPSGRTILLLHGNPTSSYLWRTVIPHLEGLGRCVAPDLIGMGDSDKLPNSGPGRYTFAEHRRFLDAFLLGLGLTAAGRIVLVVHDWGSALGFDWARRHPHTVDGVAYMEALVAPLTWADWPEAARGVFQGFRSPKGEDLILERNTFVEKILPMSVLSPLSDEVMDVYRKPFLRPGEDRRPTLTWPRQIPVDGEPPEVVADVEAYGKWLGTDDSPPKLFVNADPGSILVGPQREFCRGWPNQTEVTVPGLHFVQEDSGDAIGAAVADFIGTLS
ncbi:MAG: haloalkane dehalogenase [Actinomycetota bacterium]|nr:haloalkane dehalogenase [Actinomycetota bacterium]MDQ1507357.1 haloalkane dehalogenase [Actinomycetota bacterium]